MSSVFNTESSTASNAGQEEGWLLQTFKEELQSAEEEFTPLPPGTLEGTGLTESQIEALILKVLWNRGICSGKQLVEQIKLPFPILEEQTRRLKDERHISYKRSSGLNDYEFELSETGMKLARRYDEQASYFGAAPVPVAEYLKSVADQSLTKIRPTPASLEQAMADISLSSYMRKKLGQALTAGKGLFLYGTPGNGKTSIAERVTAAFGKNIWIPRSIDFDGDIVRFYDPIVHNEVSHTHNPQRIDQRWVRVERPTIIVGGELTMDQLEIAFNSTMGISEAPMQMKSNCGTFVVDDFGRQRMSPTDLLNRWIVPLEKRYDFLNLPSGKKIQVPFDQLLIFSTNLEPKDIVDEAFLRRIPYKIEVNPPTEPEFCTVFQIMAKKLGVAYTDLELQYLLKYYRENSREFRFCHPRDLLLQVRNYCLFHDYAIELKQEYIDEAVDNYFGMM